MPASYVWQMLTRTDLTLDCANPHVLAAFWRTAAGYVDEPPPKPFATRAEWLSQFDDESDDGMDGAHTSSYTDHPVFRVGPMGFREGFVGL